MWDLCWPRFRCDCGTGWRWLWEANPSRRCAGRPANGFSCAAGFIVFPLPKRSGFRESFRFAGDLADRGWSVLVFPEGDMTPDGKLQPFRAGIGLLPNNPPLHVGPVFIA